ncbi:MAG TPA: AbrB/MazE/SpoVT family DNA-binding domain-containing protein [Thermosulfidibacter takaii]|uniref:AbrB/MazE/SpoVT family DNA-binding domain-containing protein n=1 Tax=Thermosulfidibacter takaii TaxID=412593 RepID=A0A7C0YDQ3_9BACT|nr:MAG: AbrB family transcriptional regulator [Aquificota bacterium]HDD53100.1 AbrB/MazE/SpoVT family DNA-binding domain-containing protein [Thermosulfidibacter takaii]
MALATITSKGQVTIPKKIREALKLRPGDKIEIVITKEGEAIIRPISKKVDDVFGRLHQLSRKALTVEEMNEAIRKRLEDKPE